MKEEFSIETQLAIMDLAIKAMGKVYDEFLTAIDYAAALERLYKELVRILKAEDNV